MAFWERIRKWPVSTLLGDTVKSEACDRAGLQRLIDLERSTTQEILAIEGCGRRTAEDIRRSIGILKEVPSSVVPIEKRNPRPGSLAPELCRAVANASSLEEEILALLHSESPRNQKIVLRRWGFFSTEIPTLEQLGEDLKISRERVRQIQCQIEARLSTLFIRLPKSELVVETIDRAGGALPTIKLVKQLGELGMKFDRHSLRVLPNLARLGLLWYVDFQKEKDLWVTSRGKSTWIMTGRLNAEADRLVDLARRGLSGIGAFELPPDVHLPRDTVLRVLLNAFSDITDFTAIEDYLVPFPMPGNKLTRRVDKILAVCTSPIDVGTLSAALGRSPRLNSVPPVRIFRAMLDSRGCYRVVGSEVTSNHPLPTEEVLSKSERIATDLALNFGGIVETEEVRQHFLQTGYSVAMATAVLSGPLFQRIERGRYALIGVSGGAKGLHPTPG